MYARVTVNFGNRRSIIVPDQSIVKQEGTGTKFIYVLNEDSTVSYLPIVLGRHIGAEYEVTSGLEEGSTVVVKGQSALKDGLKVNVL
jgi:multidrug efflux pump subunit AcrA (membrane-fusion protein)